MNHSYSRAYRPADWAILALALVWLLIGALAFAWLALEVSR